MKRTLIALAVLTVFVSSLSYGVASWCVHRSVSRGMADLNDTPWLRHELSLTDAQSAAIDKLNQEFRAKVDHCCDVHCDARFALGQEIAKPQVDLTRANAWTAWPQPRLIRSAPRSTTSFVCARC